MKASYKDMFRNSLSSTSILVTTLTVSVLYIFMEWIFFATKPSFMSVLSFIDKLLILVISISLLTIVCIILIAPILLINIFTHNVTHSILNLICLIIPTLVITSMTLLLIDNFTYTVFQFGIVNSGGIIRVLYGLLFLILLIVLYNQVYKLSCWFDKKITKLNPSTPRYINLGLISLVLIICISPMFFNVKERNYISNDPNSSSGQALPHIILVTADSIDASHMSAYGYERDTTPFIKHLAESSLVAWNAFSNAQGTTGSLTSMLTGKDPLDTRVIYSPDILRDEDSYEHLPGILKALGYYNAQFSFNYYADAFDLNFLSAFDEANGRSSEENNALSAFKEILPVNIAYFVYEIGNRLINRIQHIYFIKDIENPYSQVTETMKNFNDEYKLDQTIGLLKNSKQPLFVHLHWMGTHGPVYKLAEQVFSNGQDPETQGEHNVDFYDDSILEFDQSLSDLWKELGNLNIQDNTILIVASDHSQKWSISRLPLIIRFPNSDNKQTIFENVQYTDIAPTILDYLEINQPSWMVGQSLLTSLRQDKPIIISSVGETTVDNNEGRLIHVKNPAPPFYQFGKVAVVMCDEWFQVDLINYQLSEGQVDGIDSSCTPGSQITPAQALNLIINELTAYGFDASSLKNVNVSAGH